ncbi:MAG: EAL domain-containing protein [Burkholderiales bacterium]|nr:EAL domain-containing protein [Burkholderiales bacterium]
MREIIDPITAQVEQVLPVEADDASLVGNSIQLYYQPFADLQSGSLAGFEACVALRQPASGMAPEAAGAMVDDDFPVLLDIDDSILTSIFQHARDWKSQGFEGVRIAISISLQQFCDPRLADKIGAALAAAELDSKSLCLQFTENHLVEHALSAEATLRRLRALGVCLVLDHFGAGFASLSYLRRYPFDAVKIDRSFIQALDADADAAATTQAIISMARSLGLCVQAAGVSTEDQCKFLLRNLCDEVQGMLFSPPLLPEQATALFQQKLALPEHLQRFSKPLRTLLLVDDEANILTALKRLLRRDGYRILQAGGGEEGLELLMENDVDVIVSDQRMPGMTGVEFLREAKKLRPDTVRIVLSGYTELQSITDAINEGAIYKFLTKPWDDEILRGHIEGAFKHKEMADENHRLHLEVQQANYEMAAANRRLEEVLNQQRQQIASDEASLDVVRNILQWMPLAVIGIDDQDLVVFANAAAQDLFGQGAAMLGDDANHLMPGVISAVNDADGERTGIAELGGSRYVVLEHAMGTASEPRGRILILTSLEGGAHGDWNDQ